PRGYPPDHANARLLRHRGITANRAWAPSEWLDNPDTLSLIVGTWEQADALNDWIRTHSPVR
ncbi:MAG: TIGR02453 family protein, partial [Pseudonocardiaceae bacterium]